MLRRLLHCVAGVLVGVAFGAAAQDTAPGVEASWIAVANGEAMPSGAAVGGDEPEKRYEDASEPAKTFYVCRANVGGAIQVGKVVAGGACELTHWGVPRLVERFEVLEALDSDWLPMRSDRPGGVPTDGLVIGGREADGPSVYVCRATSICKMRNTDGTTGVCTIEGRHPGSLAMAPDGSARCMMAHPAFGACTCHEYDVLVVR
jgi:hypothetical protein